MNVHTTRYVFALLCLTGLVAIATAAYVEVSRMRRGETALTPRHFRWRMISASLWVLILGSLAYGTLFEWPLNSHDENHMRRFSIILVGAMSLMMLAMVLFAVDVVLTMRERQQQRESYVRDVHDLARKEIEKIAAQKQLTSNASFPVETDQSKKP